MAISKCPKCGEMLSSSVKQCVHCGCKVVLCPECGTLNIDSSDSCVECGFSLASVKSAETAKIVTDKETVNKTRENLDSVMTAREVLESSKKEGYYSSKNPFSVLRWVVLGIGVVNCIISLIQSGFHDGIVVLAYAYAYFAISTIFDSFDRMLYFNGLRNWKKAHNADLKKVVEKTLVFKKDDEKFGAKIKQFVAVDEVITAQMIDEGKISQARRTVMSIVDEFLSGIQGVTLLLFFIENVRAIFDQGSIWASIFNISQYRMLPALIIGVVIFIVRLIVFKREPKREREKRKNWVKENFPEDVYVIYMADVY